MPNLTRSPVQTRSSSRSEEREPENATDVPLQQESHVNSSQQNPQALPQDTTTLQQPINLDSSQLEPTENLIELNSNPQINLEPSTSSQARTQILTNQQTEQRSIQMNRPTQILSFSSSQREPEIIRRNTARPILEITPIEHTNVEPKNCNFSQEETSNFVSNFNMLPGQLLNVPSSSTSGNMNSYFSNTNIPRTNNFQALVGSQVSLPNLRYQNFQPNLCDSRFLNNTSEQNHVNSTNNRHNTEPNQRVLSQSHRTETTPNRTNVNVYFPDPAQHQESQPNLNYNNEAQNPYNSINYPMNSHSYEIPNSNQHVPSNLNFINYPMNQWSNSFSNLNLPSQVRNPPIIHQTKHLYELPEFDGNPKQWPFFISEYINSTVEFQYTNLQNSMRLRKSLKGKTEKHIPTLMLNPSSVNLVLQQLEFLYGRPEILLQSQMEEVDELTNVTEETIDMIIPMSIAITNLVSFLATIPNPQIYLCNPALIDKVVSKLPLSKRDQWIRYALDIRPFYTLMDFNDWICREAQYLSLITSRNSQTNNDQKKKRVLAINNQDNSSIEKNRTKEIKAKQCRNCNKESHLLVNCPEFRKLTLPSRWEKVKSLKACFSCLRYGHQTNECTIRRKCGVDNCKSYHNRYLHVDLSNEENACYVINENISDKNELLAQNIVTRNENYNINCILTKGEILYKILPVPLYNTKGSVDVLAFIDEGTNITLIDKEIVNKLGYDKNRSKSTNMTIKWFGETTITEKSDIISLKVSGTNNGPMYDLEDVRTISNLDLPSQSLDTSKLGECYNKLKELSIKYPYDKPRILIGLNNSSLCFSENSFEVGGLIASETKLGWTVYGKASLEATERCNLVEITSDDQENTLHNIVTDYINSENLGLTSHECVSKEAMRATRILEDTTRFLKDKNRYETGLLWISDDITLPDNFSTAFNRLLFIERKMKNDLEFAKKYETNIMSYVEKNYARKLSPEEVSLYPAKRWYPPHFVSLNPHKPEKFRIVFDAASKHDGVSLNSVLLSGPDLNQPLLKVLLNFRVGKYAVCGDIQEMLNQVKIIKEDQHCQRFLWRHGDPKNPLETYVMTSMTFGATCSPCSAQYVKNENAKSFLLSHPSAANAILKNHYVDDFVMSFHTEEEALDTTLKVREIHEKGGFVLRKFESNSSKVLSGLGTQNSNENSKTLDKSSSQTEKILGLHWNNIDDSFVFKLKLTKLDPSLISGEKPPTKRDVLKIVMSIFDPFGFLNNFVVKGRIILQEIWKSKTDWDCKIPTQLHSVWKKWLEELPKLKTIKIPRPFTCTLGTCIQLHTFTDASNKAFAAVSYLKSVDNEGNIKVAFVMSKTKLASIKKPLSIPRLELQGALLGAKLKTLISNNLNIEIHEFYFWSDIEQCGNWIKGLIEKIVPNKENKIRFLEIKTKNGILKKHVSHVLFPHLEEVGEC